MAIYVVSGDIGGGKTIRMMQWMADAVKAGRPVYTNIELVPYDEAIGSGCPYADKVALIGTQDFPVAVDQDIAKTRQSQYGFKYYWEYVLPGAFVVIDEGDIYFDSAQFAEQKRQTRIFHKQVRKFRVDVVYVVQKVGSLYNRIRSLAGTFVYSENTYRTFKPFRWLDKLIGPENAIKLSRFLYFEFQDETYDMRSCRGVGHMTYQEAQVYFGWYRTEQLLGDTLTLLRPNYDEMVSDETAEMTEQRKRLENLLGNGLTDSNTAEAATILQEMGDHGTTKSGGVKEAARIGEWVDLE